MAGFLMPGDDGSFKELLAAVLPAGWSELSARQKRRFVVNFRKNQRSWRAEEPGEFQESVLQAMGQSRWRTMSEPEKRGFWNRWRYKSLADYERNCSSVQPEPPQRTPRVEGRERARSSTQPELPPRPLRDANLAEARGPEPRSRQRSEARKQHSHHRGVSSDDF